MSDRLEEKIIPQGWEPTVFTSDLDSFNSIDNLSEVTVIGYEGDIGQPDEPYEGDVFSDARDFTLYGDVFATGSVAENAGPGLRIDAMLIEANAVGGENSQAAITSMILNAESVDVGRGGYVKADYITADYIGLNSEGTIHARDMSGKRIADGSNCTIRAGSIRADNTVGCMHDDQPHTGNVECDYLGSLGDIGTGSQGEFFVKESLTASGRIGHESTAIFNVGKSIIGADSIGYFSVGSEFNAKEISAVEGIGVNSRMSKFEAKNTIKSLSTVGNRSQHSAFIAGENIFGYLEVGLYSEDSIFEASEIKTKHLGDPHKSDYKANHIRYEYREDI